MAWWEILVGIILFIVALGFLIGIHELGHLAAAKAFNVYCFNYSIGFGPKLLSTKRSAKHETIWSLRAVPLGGFVSMYGEGVESDTNEFIPPSRSLEGIARYKRAIIISAGVFLNFILGFVLILIHNGCFDHIYFDFSKNGSRAIETNEVLEADVIRNNTVACSFSDELKAQGFNDGDRMETFMDPFYGIFLLDQNVKIDSNNLNYILCMSNNLSSTKEDPKVSESLMLYVRQDVDTFTTNLIKRDVKFSSLVSFIYTNNPNRKINEIEDELNSATEGMNDQEKQEYYKPIYKNEVNAYYSNHGMNYVIVSDQPYKVSENTPDINVKLWMYHDNNPLQTSITLKQNGNGSFSDIGIYLKRFYEHYDAATTFKTTWDEWCNANIAVFKGIGMLFTGSGEVSGIVGIANVSTSVLANFGFERFLYLWGLISCNLAIMNLLPFPGLDGWALTVIIYEGIRKKQIPSRVKGIISFIGLGLLLLLMVFITIKDIIGLI